MFYQTTPSAVQFFTDSGITSPADLKGRTMAVTPGDPYTLLLPAFLQRNEINIADVKTVNVQAAAKISAVLSGQADALCGFISDQGPILTEKSGKPTGGLLFADYGLTSSAAGWLSKTTRWQQMPSWYVRCGRRQAKPSSPRGKTRRCRHSDERCRPDVRRRSAHRATHPCTRVPFRQRHRREGARSKTPRKTGLRQSRP